MNRNQLPYWLAALYLPDVGPRRMMRWLADFSDIKKLFQASVDELQAAGVNEKHIHALRHPDWKSVEQDLAWAGMSNHHIISFEDNDYPQLLKEIADPPLVLYVHGDKTALSHMQIAIVGSRHPTTAGLRNAEQFARSLVERGFAITSGLALGIDGASHRGALAAKGATIGVAGTGLDHIYPPSHRSLVDEIVSHQGAVISEFPLPALPHRTHFPRRNRTIAGLSLGVLVVEAALKSGSLVTARHALEQGREVFAIPGSIHHPLARGCHHLIRQGAKLVEAANDIIEELGAFRASFSSAPSPAMALADDLSPECRQMLELIQHEITTMDVILLRSGLTAGEVSSILLTLELRGYVQSVQGGYVRAVANQ